MNQPTERSYAAFYNGKKTILQANSLLNAKIAAINYFQPKRPHMIAVEVLDADGRIDIQRLN